MCFALLFVSLEAWWVLVSTGSHNPTTHEILFAFILEFSKFRAMSVEKGVSGPGYTSQSFGEVRADLDLLSFI